MAKRIGGMRRKTRCLMRKDRHTRGKISLSKYFQSFKQGEKVKLLQDSAVHSGAFHRRFYGKVGIVKGQKGTCYEVNVTDGKKIKMLIIHPIHMRKI